MAPAALPPRTLRARRCVFFRTRRSPETEAVNTVNPGLLQNGGRESDFRRRLGRPPSALAIQESRRAVHLRLWCMLFVRWERVSGAKTRLVVATRPAEEALRFRGIALGRSLLEPIRAVSGPDWSEAIAAGGQKGGAETSLLETRPKEQTGVRHSGCALRTLRVRVPLPTNEVANIAPRRACRHATACSKGLEAASELHSFSYRDSICFESPFRKVLKSNLPIPAASTRSDRTPFLDQSHRPSH